MTTARKPMTFDPGHSEPRVMVAVSTPAKATQQRQQVGARVTATTYRQLKARAALQGVAVGELVEQAITEFLAAHP